MYVINELLKAHEFYRTRNIKVDLVIVNEERNSYERYIKFEIDNAILNRQIKFLKNVSGGIFVIENVPEEDLETLEIRSNILLDAGKGKLSLQLEDLEEEYLSRLSNISEDEIKPKEGIDYGDGEHRGRFFVE